VATPAHAAIVSPRSAAIVSSEGGGEPTEEALVVVDHPSALARVVDLSVPADVGMPQRAPGLCFGDRHDLLLLGRPSSLREKGRLGGRAR
jgi:hypothetical protein